jgi:hypothetical protein
LTDDKALLFFNRENFIVKITQINGDKHKGTIIKAGFDPKVHPTLVVSNDVKFEEHSIFVLEQNRRI